MKLRTFRLNFAPGAELPKRLLVAKWGVNKSVNGDYTVNDTTARELPLKLKSVNFDTADLDFEHNTVPGSPSFRAEKEPRKIAARGTLEVVAGEGIVLNVAHWTPEGTDAVKGGHFPDLSPAILTNRRGEIVFIHSVALARHGATDDLPLALNSSDPLLALFSADEQSTTMLDYKKLLLSVLDLPDTASDSEVNAAVQKECDEPDDDNPDNAAVKTMSARLDELTGKFAAIEKAGEKSERDALITRAIAAGKIITQSAKEMPLDLLKRHIEELPADQVPLEKRTPDTVQMHASGLGRTGGMGAEEEVRQKLGLTKEQWDKHNK